MEGSNLIRRERVVFTFEFDLELAGEEGLAPPDVVAAVVADVRPSLDELRSELAHQAARTGQPIDIEDIEIREGSILIVVAATVGVVKALDLYGGARQGFDQILRDFASICERFLWRFGGRRLRPRLRMTSCATAAVPTGNDADDEGRLAIRYLIASNGLLLLTLIGALILLLARTS